MPVNNGIEYEVMGTPSCCIHITSVNSVNDIDLFLSEVHNGNNYSNYLFDFSFEGSFVSNSLSFYQRVDTLFDVYEVIL